MEKFWLIMSGEKSGIPTKFECSHQSLAAAQREAQELACDGRAYYVFEMMGCYVQEINWKPSESRPTMRDLPSYRGKND